MVGWQLAIGLLAVLVIAAVVITRHRRRRKRARLRDMRGSALW